MNSTPIKTALLTAVVAVMLLPAAPSANATDYKTFTGTACMPYGANTSWADLTYRPSGVTTEGTANEYILCGLTTDTESGWGVGTEAAVTLAFKTGSANSPITCTANVGSAFLIGGALTYAGSLTLSANTTGNLTIPSLTSDSWYAWVPVSVNCRLPPKTTLARIYMNETISTYTPPI